MSRIPRHENALPRPTSAYQQAARNAKPEGRGERGSQPREPPSYPEILEEKDNVRKICPVRKTPSRLKYRPTETPEVDEELPINGDSLGCSDQHPENKQVLGALEIRV